MKGNILMLAEENEKVFSKNNLTRRQQLEMVVRLSMPAILAQLSTVVMQYIDTAMVGSLGANATASIGLITTTVYLTNGFCTAAYTGFSVQIAHAVGAGDLPRARSLFRQSLLCTWLLSLLLSVFCMAISGVLPVWLAGDEAIRADASGYFLIYSAAIPFLQLNLMAGAAIQCSGNMKLPGIVNTAMCVLDVIFNAVFIFLFNMGVQGAAAGTALAQLCAALFLVIYGCFFSDKLNIRRFKGKWLLKDDMRRAMKISFPVACEEFIMCGTFIITTRILAPYGAVNVAAYSLVSTAEGICYMPGFGIGIAATTLIGQSLGAGNKRLARQFGNLIILFGTAVMSGIAAIFFFSAPFVFSMLTNDPEVYRLGVLSLQIELFAEPLFAVQLVTSGIFRGAGDTLPAAVINAVSMWGLRLLLIFLLIEKYEVVGVWLSVCVELCIRGFVYLLYYRRGLWLDKKWKGKKETL